MKRNKEKHIEENYFEKFEEEYEEDRMEEALKLEEESKKRIRKGRLRLRIVADIELRLEIYMLEGFSCMDCLTEMKKHIDTLYESFSKLEASIEGGER